MDSAAGTNLLDLFDLDNGDDLDFETAYKMISNFDDDMVLPKMNLVDFTEIGLSESLTPLVHASEEHREEGHQEQKNAEDRGDKPWDPQSLNDNHDHLKDSLSTSGSINGTHGSTRPDLLSTYESNAIEHFLDNLISQDDEMVLTKSECKSFEIPHLEMNKSMDAQLPSVEENAEKRKTSFSEYVAPIVKIPDFNIADSQAPADVANDPKLLRKWKHVEVERLRRNNIKQTFEELISLTKYPRGDRNKILKPSTDKRVPKHTLLSFIVEDMKSVLQANRKLEFLLQEAEGTKRNSDTSEATAAVSQSNFVVEQYRHKNQFQTVEKFVRNISK